MGQINLLVLPFINNDILNLDKSIIIVESLLLNEDLDNYENLNKSLLMFYEEKSLFSLFSLFYKLTFYDSFFELNNYFNFIVMCQSKNIITLDELVNKIIQLGPKRNMIQDADAKELFSVIEHVHKDEEIGFAKVDEGNYLSDALKKYVLRRIKKEK